MGILPGTDGRVKMSKSLGNHIPILSSPNEMFGKVMSVPDGAVRSYFTMVTGNKPPEIETIMNKIDSGCLHPRDVKMRLAREIVTIFHSAGEAELAETEFIQIFRNRGIPEDMPAYRVCPDETLLDVLSAGGLISTKSEGRRLILQRGVRFNGETLSDPGAVGLEKGILQIGKRRFLRII